MNAPQVNRHANSSCAGTRARPGHIELGRTHLPASVNVMRRGNGETRSLGAGDLAVERG